MAGRKRKATAKKIEKNPTSDDPGLQETRSPRSTIRGAAKKRPKDWEEDVILDLGRKAVRRPRSVFLNLFCLATQNVDCNLSATPAS